MKTSRLILTSLVLSLLFFAVFATPLLRHGHRGIAYSYRPEPGGPVYMAPGDHLQLMYHFWLFSDSLWSDTPFFRNPYEFNPGRDAPDPRIDGGAYYAPFGQFFGLLEPAVGQAAAWNLTGFVSLWAGFLAMVLLLRRHVRHDWIALLGAAPVIMLPYRWIALLGGSPTGFAMMWPPVIMLGIDIALRDRRLRGAWLAGLALLLSKWSDTHVFFFSFLAIPPWVLIALVSPPLDVKRAEVPSSPVSAALRRLMRLWPLALCMGTALLSTMLIARSLEGSLMESGRGFREVLLFSPVFRGLISWHTLSGHDFQIYLGRVMLLTLGAGFVLLALDGWRKQAWAGRHLVLYGLILAAVAVVALLSLGPRLPLDPHQVVFQTLRRLIPPYRMIRQTAKIYAVLPPLLALAFGLALQRLSQCSRRPKLGLLVAGLITLAALGDYARRIQPAVCLLDREQAAYAAVVEDAGSRARAPRALALPLWPGDAHWSSLYEYYASLYRIRMLNGYSPVVGRDYLTDIFAYFAPLNTGYIDDERLDDLLERGIDYLLLHEDAFPEKVSPFPVHRTLDALRRHPRLRLLARDRAVWAFRIEAEPDPVHEAEPSVSATLAFPARAWDFAFLPQAHATVRDAPGAAHRGRFLRVSAGDAPMVTPPQPVHDQPGLRYLVRVRGSGRMRAWTEVAHPEAEDPAWRGDATGEAIVRDAPPDWAWMAVPAPAFAGYRPLRLAMEVQEGHADFDLAVLAAGDWPFPAPGESLRLPADAFFRAGYSLPETGAIVLERQRVKTTPFYGPNHVLPAGLYTIELSFQTPAGPGVELGRLALRMPAGADAFEVPLTAGEPCRVEYRHAQNLPFGLELRFARNADLTLLAVTLHRLE